MPAVVETSSAGAKAAHTIGTTTATTTTTTTTTANESKEVEELPQVDEKAQAEFEELLSAVAALVNYRGFQYSRSLLLPFLRLCLFLFHRTPADARLKPRL